MGRLIASVLIAACAVQVVALAASRGPIALQGPTVGRPLPDFGLVAIGHDHPRSWPSIIAQRKCTLLVVISPTCAACRLMRDTWSARLSPWLDSVAAPVRPVWLIGSDDTSARAFVAGYDLARTTIVAWMTSDVTEAGRTLGIIGTPTYYLLDREGRLRVGVLGDEFPPADSARRACRDRA
jgi:hypothetical protein